MFSAPRDGTCELQYRLQSNKAGRDVERVHGDSQSSGGLFNTETMTRRVDTPPLLQKGALVEQND